MSVKDKLLLYLYQSFSREVPVKTLADLLETSQHAIHEAIVLLRKEGFVITSSSKDGYALTCVNDRFVLPYIEHMLQREDPSFRLFFEETIDSTNTEAKRRLAKGEPTPFLIIAKSQSAGRGRLGRDFYSPDGGLYMSLALSDIPVFSEGVRYTAAAALATAEALESLTGEAISIKWVNDLYYKGKKISGILTEGIFDAQSSSLAHLILGIGINLKENAFPEELRARATHIPFDSNQKSVLVVEIVKRIADYFSTLDNPAFLSGYRERCFVLGERITFTKGGQEYSGVAIEVDDWGGLVVMTTKGRQTLQSGEIFLRGEEMVDYKLRMDPEAHSK